MPVVTCHVNKYHLKSPAGLVALDSRIAPIIKIHSGCACRVHFSWYTYIHVTQSCGNKVSLKVLHRPSSFASSQPPHDHHDYGRSGDLDMTSSDPGSYQTFPPPPEYPYGATGRQPTSELHCWHHFNINYISVRLICESEKALYPHQRKCI